MYTGRDESSILDLLAEHRDYPCHIRAHVAREDKWERAQAFAAAHNRGEVVILSTLPKAEELVRQLGRFTGLDGDSDDLVDAAVAAYDEIAAGTPRIEPATDADEVRGLRPAVRMARRRWT